MQKSQWNRSKKEGTGWIDTVCGLAVIWCGVTCMVMITHINSAGESLLFTLSPQDGTLLFEYVIYVSNNVAMEKYSFSCWLRHVPLKWLVSCLTQCSWQLCNLYQQNAMQLPLFALPKHNAAIPVSHSCEPFLWAILTAFPPAFVEMEGSAVNETTQPVKRTKSHSVHDPTTFQV